MTKHAPPLATRQASLTPDVAAILFQQQTERPHTSPYTQPKSRGYYICRGCGTPLFSSQHQFHSKCGWPSFDDALAGHVATQPDEDGQRTEVHCAQCAGHLGHVFTGEQLTANNTRYCINGLAMDWVDDATPKDTEECILAGGCFWGVEALLSKHKDVLKTEVGYCGGQTNHPTYRDVCQGNTGHVEAVRVIFDSQQCSLQTLLRYFLEIHDPYQHGGQGPDIGPQYQSCIFYYPSQQTTATQVLNELSRQPGTIATQLRAMQPFWRAEEDHQQYLCRHPNIAICHRHTPRFGADTSGASTDGTL